MAEVRKATVEEIPRLAETLASAFSEDPVFRWMVPENSHIERMRRFFAGQLRATMKHQSVFTNDSYDGVAIWLPPDNWKVPTADLVRIMPTLMRSFGTRLPRVLGGLSVIEKNHPKDPPHWYLEFLGTRQDLQRKGIGSALIGFMLDQCDREAIPAYLEASSPENVPFYARHGFEVLEELRLKNGPPIWAMMRQPKSP